MNVNWIEMSTEEALAQWFRDEPMMSVTMSGVGPSHEQVVQLLGFEMLRVMTERPIDWDDSTEEELRYYYATIHIDPRVSAIDMLLDPTGAQLSAALSMASMYARQGYGRALEMLEDKDRMIMVCRRFPLVPSEQPQDELLESLS